MNKIKNQSFKYFIILLCISLFGAANNTINYSSIEIPLEDLSEEFKDAENKNDQINALKNSSKNIVSYKDPKKGKDLKLPENIRDKKLFKKRMDENDIKSVIENYESKIRNIEKLLKSKNQKALTNENKKIESIEKKAKKYEILTNKLKNEIIEIKKLLNKRSRPIENENYEKINIENIEEEDDDDFEENYEYNDEAEETNGDNYPSNEGIINNLKEKLYENEKYYAINEKKFDELEDRINDNENTILDLQRELRNFKKKDDSNKNLEEIEENLSLIGKIINGLKAKVSANEAINKENQKKLRTDKHKLKELEDKIKENEETILKLQKELNNFKKKEISQQSLQEETFVPSIPNKNDDLEEDVKLEKNYLKPIEKNESQDLEKNVKSTPKTTMIKTADFQIYPDIYFNNYKFKEKGDQFEFKKENTYYIEINPTNNLNEALKNHEIISKYKFEKYFINPTLKNNEEFFRNLIEVKNIHELGIMYKSLKPEFKQIKIIK
ncbi:hypothetical protein QIA25_03355 [Borreliella spielmanii]|uniref:Uncharacterized protein n=1 Tax=Borreliella spielmanii A14S TaxID=498742 RepID=B9X8F7_9SPIR|nr:hypothetical protein [Borreliella spielmanii]EEF84245.1 conserved hypothetical protein [Borreliella spielmanii A14S]WKC83619.1 hypothetical protein QIA25_03355 [Borreliella spielmanii]